MKTEEIILTVLNKWYRDAAQPIYRYQVMRTPVWVLIIGAITLIVVETNVSSNFRELEKMVDKINVMELTKVEVARFENQKADVSRLLLLPSGLKIIFRLLFFIFSYHLMRGMVVDSYRNAYLKLFAQAGPNLDQNEKLRSECAWINIQTKEDYDLLIDYLKTKAMGQQSI